MFKCLLAKSSTYCTIFNHLEEKKSLCLAVFLFTVVVIMLKYLKLKVKGDIKILVDFIEIIFYLEKKREPFN